MLYFLLMIFLYLGLFIGIISGLQELNNSKQVIKHKSIINYWLGK